MNIQAMMKQAQKLQQDMMASKNEINRTIYTGEKSFVKVEINGNHEVISIKIDKKSMDSDDVEMLEDLLAVSINEANKKIEKDTEEKLGKYTKGMPGLF